MTKKTPITKPSRGLVNRVDMSFYHPKDVLARYGWDQKRLAKELGILNSSLSAIINGNPSIAQVKAMADVIGCSFTEFFTNEAPDITVPRAIQNFADRLKAGIDNELSQTIGNTLAE